MQGVRASLFAGALSLLFAPAFSSSLSFVNGDAVVIPNDPSLNFDGDFTVEAWVKPNSDILLDPFDFVVSKQLNGTGYTLLQIDNSFQFESYGDPDFSQTYFATALLPLVPDEWVHLAGVRAGDANLLYIDGNLAANVAVPENVVPNSLDLYIGGSIFGNPTSWNGLIDEVRIWSDARTEKEISNDQFVSIIGSRENLVGNWRFESGGGSTLLDSSGLENSGLISGAAWSPENAPVAPIPLPAPFTLLVMSIFGLIFVGSQKTKLL